MPSATKTVVLEGHSWVLVADRARLFRCFSFADGVFFSSGGVVITTGLNIKVYELLFGQISKNTIVSYCFAEFL